MVYGSKEYNDILGNFKKGRAWLNDVSVEIVGEENELDALTLLRAYDEEPTIDSTLALTAKMVLNKEVRFLRNGKLIFSITYSGGDLSEKFVKAPFLLDTLMKLCYGLMIKKLTPPSEDSETEEQR
jgi:hypothetical protein